MPLPEMGVLVVVVIVTVAFWSPARSVPITPARPEKSNLIAVEVVVNVPDVVLLVKVKGVEDKLVCWNVANVTVCACARSTAHDAKTRIAIHARRIAVFIGLRLEVFCSRVIDTSLPRARAQ